MANQKAGLNFYTIDTDRYQDIRIKRLKKDNGCDGIAVYDYILCEIYRVRGYFLEWDESSAFDVAEYFGLKETKVQGIVEFCASVGLFDKALLSRGVITSAAIQQRYLTMCNRAKRVGVEINPDYRLIEEENQTPRKINDSSVSLPDSSVRMCDSSVSLPQSKVKESKVKESKENNPPQYAREGGGDSFSSSIHELASLVSEDDYYEAMRLSSWGKDNLATPSIMQWIEMKKKGMYVEEFYRTIQTLQRIEDLGQLTTICSNRLLWKAKVIIHKSRGIFSQSQAKELFTLADTYPEAFITSVNEWNKNKAKIQAPYNFIKSKLQ